MKVMLKTSNGFVEAESDKHTALFEELSSLQEVFDHSECGVCKKTNLRFVMRENQDEDKFYEVHCRDCRARLSFGCSKKGNMLYPKVKWDALSPGEKLNRAHQEKECRNGYLPNKGWYKYVPTPKTEVVS